ncbi:MAG: glutamate-cysteine ligase family protein [Deltaproteobacteria bacterium]|nr:glutamate-cysteine ligase family protein [Deltaproteobacteria bacterium]
MGTSIERERFDEEEFKRFSERLSVCLATLRELLRRPGFGKGPATLGAELEFFLVDETGRPLSLNQAVLAEMTDPRFTTELNRFNLECNLTPSPLAGSPFTALGQEIRSALAEARRAVGRHGGRIATIGILPTLRPEDLQRGAMSDVPRYRALSAGLQRLRGGAPFEMDIHGDDVLQVSCDDVTFEGAGTSFQVHLRVDPAEFAGLYNAAQVATAPVLSVAGNSPTFLGRRLWRETRVALFKQAIDERPEAGGRRQGIARVSFGNGWVRRDALELFAESVILHEPLLPIMSDENPAACLRSGGTPGLAELRLHQGTVWRWNRAIYDPVDGGHLRIELRVLPSGPTITDMLANAVFLIGLTHGLAPRMPEWISVYPFAMAHRNFYRAAKSGLDAELAWPRATGRGVDLLTARELVHRLLPLAREGLLAAGIAPAESDPLLGMIEARSLSGQTAAVWQRAMLEDLEASMPREEALRAMFERYLALSDKDEPVHRWPLEGQGKP